MLLPDALDPCLYPTIVHGKANGDSSSLVIKKRESMASQGAGLPRSWSPYPIVQEHKFPQQVTSPGDILDHNMSGCPRERVSMFSCYGSHQIYRSYPELPGTQKLRFLYISKPPCISKDTAKCQSPTSSKNITFRPTFKPQSHKQVELPALKVYRLQLTYQTVQLLI